MKLQLKQRLTNEKALFVIINVVANILLLVRSYLFMIVLNYTELGIITLLQSVVLLISTLQFGVINGGYRLLCTESEENAQRINSFFYAFVFYLSIACSTVGGILTFLFNGQDYTFIIALGIFAGIVTLIRTWITNQMIALIMLRKLNMITFISSFISVFVLLFVSINPLQVCLISIVIHPLVFIVYILFKEKSLRPVGISFSFEILRRVMATGFVMFLTGMFVLINTQIERWSILSELGIESLGHYYLALLFINVFGLIPTSLGSIYLPQILKLYADKAYNLMQNVLKQFIKVSLLYSIIVIFGVLLLAQPFIDMFLSKYSNDLIYLYLVLPGLILLSLTTPFGLVFEATIQYKYYFRSYFMGTVFTALLVLLFIYGVHSFSLIT